jgi:hypothetical protein
VADKEEKPIRVVDRRMFTAEGELRPDFEPEESPAPPAQPAPAASRQAPPREPRPTASPAAASPSSAASTAGQAVAEPQEPGEEEVPPGEPAGEFSAIVRSLATTAYSAMGLLPDPSGARHRDPAIARQMIDWLGVLESKTRNNLSFEESDFLARVLYELRLAFVEVTRPARR